MSKVRIYKIPTAIEVETRYASAAGVTLEVWNKMEEKDRTAIRGQVDATAKKVERAVRAADRAQYYAAATGMSVEAWRGLSAVDRKAKREEIDARDKAERAAEREAARQRAENVKLKREAKQVKHKKGPAKSLPAGLPGATRYSTVIGLMTSPSDKKWNQFLREGPYWNYLVKHVRRMRIFDRQDRVEEAVMNACEKIGRFLVGKRFKYPEEGKGYFRAFIKSVAFSSAIDLYKSIRRQEMILDAESSDVIESEEATIQKDMESSFARRRKQLERRGEAAGIETEIPPSAERDLDVYDMSAGLDRNIAPKEKNDAVRYKRIESLDYNPFSDDELPVNYDLASFFDFMTNVSKADLDWVQHLQIHVLYIALGYVLTNERVTAERRELLRLRYGLDMKVKDILRMPRYERKTRDSVDALLSHATDVLRKEAASWWKLVAPDKNDFADETVLKFWRELSRKESRSKIAIALHNKANNVAGPIK